MNATAINLHDWTFYVILSVDTSEGVSIAAHNPGRKWHRTEGDSEYDYGYLEGAWTKGKHRKWVAEVSFDELRRVCDKEYLSCTDVETMGSLCELGHIPAFSFDYNESFDYIINAYVTPFPPKGLPESETPTWNEVKAAMLAEFC